MRKVGLSLFFLSQAISGISQCEDMEVEVIGVNPTCHNFCDGAVYIDVLVAALPAEVSVMDSLGNVFYALPGGAMHILCDGWYYISVIDSLGCVFEDSVELINPDPIVVEYTVIPPSEPGACDGLGTVDTVYGYQGDYAAIYISWSPDGPAGIDAWFFEDMCANTYLVFAGDEFGCTGVEEFSVGSLVSLPEKTPVDVTLIQKNNLLEIINFQQEIGRIEIYNLAGELIMHQILTLGTTEINMTHLSGVFIYKISLNNEEVLTGKLKF